MAVNKVVVNEQPIIDLTDDTVTASKLFKGITAHNKAGEQIVGTAEVSTIYSGTEDPSATLGKTGDVYLKLG